MRDGMSDIGDLAKIEGIKLKATMLGVKATAQKGVKKKDLEEFEKLHRELNDILDTKVAYKNRLQVTDYFSQAEGLRTQIEKTLTIFKTDFHLDKDGWYVDKNGKRC